MIRQRAEFMLVRARQSVTVPTGNQRLEMYRRHASSIPDTCPDLTDAEKSSTQLSVTSSCPWEVEQDFDAYRYPKIMSFAKCKCPNCRGNPDSSCEIIWQDTVVLRHNGTCVDGMYLYEPYLEPVSVGCACTPIMRVPASAESKRRRRSLAHILRGGFGRE